MYSAIEHFVNMALYKCCILLFIIITVYRSPNCDGNVFLGKLHSSVDDCVIRS